MKIWGFTVLLHNPQSSNYQVFWVGSEPVTTSEVCGILKQASCSGES